MKNDEQRILLSKLRISNHDLEIEVFDVLTLFKVKITVKTKYQMSIDYSTSFWVNCSEHFYPQDSSRDSLFS
jgi:hypothetical protein